MVELGGFCFRCEKLTGEHNRMEKLPNGYFCSKCKAFESNTNPLDVVANGNYLANQAIWLIRFAGGKTKKKTA